MTKKVEEKKEVIIQPGKRIVTGSSVIQAGGLETPCKSCAIVGFAPSSMTDVQFLFGNPDVEIWALNQLYIAFPAIVPGNRPPEKQNLTRWFQIHHRHSYDQTVMRDHSHHDWMAQQQGFPIYMQDKLKDVPWSIQFPKDEILAKFRRYFTNSISWMIALAIYEKFEKIYVFGVDMAQDCIDPNTKILTSDLRWIPAKDIKVGDSVIGFDEHTGPQMPGRFNYRQWRNAEVQEANRLIKPSYKLTLEDGSELICSAGHQWLTYGENEMKWKRTDEMVTNMHRHPTKIVKAVDMWEEDKSYDAGYLAGAFDGEGHFVHQYNNRHNGVNLNLGFAQRENEMAANVERILEAKGIKFHYTLSQSKLSDTPCKKYSISGGKAEVMKFLGSMRPQRLLNNFNPNEIGSFHKKEAIAVIKAEFLGDHEVIGFKTSTKTFIAEGGFASHNSEYAFERPSVEYFCGYAEGAGINLIIPEKSDLLKSAWLYPFEQDSTMKTKIDARRGELRARANQIASEEQNCHDSRMQLIGALENMNYIQRAWTDAVKENMWPGQFPKDRG